MNMTCRPRTLAILTCLLFLNILSGCMVGPDYLRPAATETPSTDTFKAAPAHWGEWHPAQPRQVDDSTLWWQLFNDNELDALMAKVKVSNQNIRAAEANYRQAQAAVQASRSAYYPVIGADAGRTRGRNTAGTSISDIQSATLSANWEIDIWGSVRRQVENSMAAAQASEDDLAALQLSTQSTLAQNYFLLRVTDAQQVLLERIVADYAKFLELVRNQYAAGTAQRTDILQAETQLKTAEAQLVDIKITREQYQNALANLAGSVPADFSIPPVVLDNSTANLLSQIPPALPSQLLERRPDIAAAERRMAAANAQIGVTQAAYYPHLTLSGNKSYSGNAPRNWLDLPDSLWSIGPKLAVTIFDGGARSAARKGADAAYDASVANYRQTVLNAFQEVENNLAALRLLKDEAAAQEEALKSAREALTLITYRYRAGTASLLDVLTAQTAAQTAEINTLTLVGRQFTTSAALITALGGIWPTTPGAGPLDTTAEAEQ